MSLYRCAECGHGGHLYAWSQAVAYGPVHTDGLLARHEDVDDCFLFIDSIQCARHPSAQIQTKIGSRFHVWERCVFCNADQERLRDRGYYGPCPDCKGSGGRWALPAERSEPRRASTAPESGARSDGDTR